MIIRLIAGEIKNISLYKMSYYPKADSNRNKKNIELDLLKLIIPQNLM